MDSLEIVEGPRVTNTTISSALRLFTPKKMNALDRNF